MDLWIRSQNKERLCKVEELIIEEYAIVSGNDTIYEYDIMQSHYTEKLGRYKTKERAMEVVDEIQKLMFSDKNYNGNYQTVDLAIKGIIAGNMLKIYQMPEE